MAVSYPIGYPTKGNRKKINNTDFQSGVIVEDIAPLTDATNDLNTRVVALEGDEGEATWGEITGTLSAQTDLQSALDAKQALVPRVQSVVSAATVTPTALNDLVVVTALAAACQFLNPTGTYVQGQAYFISIKDNATPRALTWDTKYVAYGSALPTTTTTSKRLLIPVIYDSIGDTHMVLTSQLQQ